MKGIASYLFFLTSLFSAAQVDKAPIDTAKSIHKNGSNNYSGFKDWFLKSKLDIYSRTFFMSTINESALKDDQALASGVGASVLTAPLYGFQFGVKGFFVYNLWSSKIHDLDTIARSPNRYEIGLFDIEDQSDKRDFSRIEELYVKYNISKSAITIGRINLNTPFFNPQDGRMTPTVEEGVWINVLESKKVGFNGGWLWGISPRSTVHWYCINNSVGIYPMGVDVNGNRSNFKGQIKSNGFAIANFYINPSEHFKINIWDGYFENVMNTAMIELNTDQKINEKSKIYQGLIFLHQDAVNDGGNSNRSKTYINKEARSNVISARVGVRGKRTNTSLNYTHITGDGRYLMPREWGRDPFYTFMPRERNEGLGNVNAFVIRTSLNAFQNKFTGGLAYGYFMLPDVKNYRLNKYGMPSYHQMNLDIGYSFKDFLKGLDIKLLTVYKLNAGETYGNPKNVYNKVNMMNLNLVVDLKI